jgi:hypothetical protein
MKSIKMPLKKPSQLFHEEITSFEKNSDLYVENADQTLNNFKSNVSLIEELSDKISYLGEEITDEITRSDLEDTIISHLMVLSEVTSKMKKINTNDLSEVKRTTQQLTETVDYIIKDQIPKYKKKISETESKIDKKFESFAEEIEEYFKILEDFNLKFKDFESYIVSLKTDFVIVEERNKKLNDDVDKFQENTETKFQIIEKYIHNNRNDIKKLKEEVYYEVDNIKLGNIQENVDRLNKKLSHIEKVYLNIKPEDIVNEVIAETFSEPPSSQNSDPLTPLDKNYVTLDQLQDHYRLFINRIQQQLATFGGGGETRLKYLDDIVGISTNASFYDGKFLKYDHAVGKFVFETVSGGGESYWVSTNIGIHTTSNVGIATTNPISQLSIGSFYGVDTTTIAISTKTPTAIDSFSATDFRSARLQIQITQGTDYQATDLLTIHNGSSVNIIEYGSIATNNYLGTFDGIVVGGNVIILITMNSETTATVKVVSNKITL